MEVSSSQAVRNVQWDGVGGADTTFELIDVRVSPCVHEGRVWARETIFESGINGC